MTSGSIRKKIWLCVLVALGGYLIATLTSLYSNSNLVKDLSHLQKVAFPLTFATSELFDAFDEQCTFFEEGFYQAEPEYADKGVDLHATILQFFDQVLAITSGGSEQHHAQGQALQSAYLAYFEEAAVIYPQAATAVGNSSVLEQVFELGKKQRELHQKFEVFAQIFITDFQGHIEQDKQKAAQNSYMLLALFTFVLMIASFFINRVSNRLLVNPLGKIQQMVTDFGMGEKVAAPEIESPDDEISSLASSFYQLTEVLQATTVSKNYVDNIIRNMTDCLIVLNAEAKIQTINQTTVEMLGYREDELVGESIVKLFGDQEKFVFKDASMNELLKKGFIRNIETSCTTKYGHNMPVLFSGSVMRNEQQAISGIVCVIADVTELKKAEEALKGSYDFLKTIINSLNESVSIINVADYRIESFNKVFMDHYRLSEEDAAEKVCYRLIHGMSHPCTEKDRHCPLQETVKTGKYAHAEYATEADDGELHYLEVATTPIFDEGGEITQVVHVSRDITEKKKAEEQLEQMAHFDNLTGLPNRTLFSDRLSQGIRTAKRQKGQLAVFFMDLDNFKPINDSLGHDAGDLVLIEAANRLQTCIRECDTAGRIGGDEFTLLLVNLENRKNVEIVAQRILDSFKKPFTVGGRDFNVGISIGISVSRGGDSDAESLMKYADMAMYDVKEQGKNTYRIYSP